MFNFKRLVILATFKIIQLGILESVSLIIVAKARGPSLNSKKEKMNPEKLPVMALEENHFDWTNFVLWILQSEINQKLLRGRKVNAIN